MKDEGSTSEGIYCYSQHYRLCTIGIEISYHTIQCPIHLHVINKRDEEGRSERGGKEVRRGRKER